MYELQFSAVEGTDWAEAIEMIDSTTNQPLALDADALIELGVGDRFLHASTADGTILRPTASIIQWRFSADRLHPYCSGRTSPVSCRVTTNGGTIPLFIGTLSLIKGTHQWH